MADWTPLLELGGPLVAGGAGAAYARVKAPRAYWSAIGLPVTAARIAHSYAEVMEACGLAVEPSMWRTLVARGEERQGLKPTPPRVRGVRPTATGLRLRLRLARGQETADVVAAAERLRHAWGVHAAYVSEIRPGVVDLRLVGFDVLRRVRMPRAVRAGHPVRVPVALREDGTVFVRDYRTEPHSLILGAGQAGKSTFVRNLVCALAVRPVALVGIDCKRGVEHAPFAPRLSALATDPDAALDVLRALVAEMDARYDLIRAQQGIPGWVPDEQVTADIWGLPATVRPVPVVVVVDEIAELFLVATKADEKRRNEIVTALVRLAQLARAAGIFLDVAGQRFGADLGRGATLLRSQLTARVVHRVNDVETARMGLGDISEQAMAAATQIPPGTPGLAVAGDASGAWSRIRPAHLSLADAARICRNSAHLVPDLPRLDAFRPVAAVPAPRIPPKPTRVPAIP
ncbi:conjugal transfer protein TraS [Streptacidiphilus sp. ASG 303]|uniref:FtsK/SpoIIIE domain-containing protein n=1 Tax=Streptacidiphilus sp. ASG 303 TaxID=2896847 RepID=UPI001E4A41E4|nr:FtsK/SpoIIIE domain-containing protein [Streptacidiphilus sp. ASG 303]MCD0482327.1 conjugal transfer protein TraS [Streptacidiphilus sp. ASG 303]